MQRQYNERPPNPFAFMGLGGAGQTIRSKRNIPKASVMAPNDQAQIRT